MEDERERQRKEEERKRREANLVNPFPTGVNEVVIHLDDDHFAEAAGTYVIDRSGEDPRDRVELQGIGASREIQQAHQQGKGESTGTPSGIPDYALVPIGSPSGNKLQSNPQPPAQHSLTKSATSLGMWRAHTAFGAALLRGTLNEKNPTRDYTWAVIFGLAALGCFVAGATHGNFVLMGAGLFLGLVSTYLNYRASQSDPNKSHASSLSRDFGCSQRSLL